MFHTMETYLGLSLSSYTNFRFLSSYTNQSYREPKVSMLYTLGHLCLNPWGLILVGRIWGHIPLPKKVNLSPFFPKGNISSLFYFTNYDVFLALPPFNYVGDVILKIHNWRWWNIAMEHCYGLVGPLGGVIKLVIHDFRGFMNLKLFERNQYYTFSW